VADKVLRVTDNEGPCEAILKEIVEDGPLMRVDRINQSTSDLALLFKYIDAMGVLGKVRLSLSLARGLDYYTGVIFEAVIDGAKFGSIAAGGRYDNLVGMFCGRQVEAVGCSIGISRIVAHLLQRNTKNNTLSRKNAVSVLVCSMGDVGIHHRMRICAELWEAGISAEYLHVDQPKPGRQLGYALSHEIPLLVFVGEDELRTKTVAIKDLARRTQISVGREHMVQRVSDLLAANTHTTSGQKGLLPL